MANNLRKTRDCFLWFISVVYLFAFSSLYVQIPGLYGNHGILPSRLVIKTGNSGWQELMEGHPSLLKLLPRLGMDISIGMDLMALSGMVIAFFCVVSRTARDLVSFTLLWMFYLSLYQVGQTFMWFQWDILLLETGFLAIIIAPFNLQVFMRRWSASNPHDGITLWLARWLLFRLMFASGVVKLTSLCPTWWGLTALNVHFESQCIPTPAAWYWHNLPDWMLRLGVVATYVIEIAVPFLFFSPIRFLRLFAFWAQVLLQLLIIVTGNYNFFNILTISLCISLLDDKFWLFYQRPQNYSGVKASPKPSSFPSRLASLLSGVVSLAVIAFILYKTSSLFSLSIGPGVSIQSKIAFTEADFFKFLEQCMPYTIILGAVSLGLEIIVAFGRSLLEEKGLARKAFCVLGTTVFAIVAVFMFTISLVSFVTPLSKSGSSAPSVILPKVVHKAHGMVPHSEVDQKALNNVPRTARTWHRHLESFHLANAYGLFRTMTGVGGRPELVLEGHPSDRNADSGWKEYHFLYKPGDVMASPPVVAPHQPRLDWQMWFAALGNYQNNPWLLNTVYRLLQNKEEVLQLIGVNPFPSKPPKYIRATLYHYHYTTPKECATRQDKCGWWSREKKADYLPPISIQDKSFVDYLKHYKFLDESGKDSVPEVQAPSWMSDFLLWLRQTVGQPEGFHFVSSVFWSAILVMFLNRALF